MAIKDNDLAALIDAEEQAAVGFSQADSSLHARRQTLMDNYYQRPYGDEVEGQSKYVTSDVMDTVETILPLLVRVFTQNHRVAKFTSVGAQYDDEAQQKTEYAHWVFNELHDGTVILHDMFKDGLLQYTGIVKVSWDKRKQVRAADYPSISGVEAVKLLLDEDFELESLMINGEKIALEDVSLEVLMSAPELSVKGKWIEEEGRPCLENVVPDELVIAARAKDFIDPPFIGQRTPRTRSELIEMGFPKKLVKKLSGTDTPNTPILTPYDDNGMSQDIYGQNPTNDKSKDVIWLGEYYTYFDSDGDGISELWQVFYADHTILEKNQVEDHPYCVFVPIRMPHKSVGLCPADQVSDIQLLKSKLVRGYLDNLYYTNFPRVLADERVNIDHLLTLRPGGVIAVSGEQGAVGAVMPLTIPSQGDVALQGIQLVDAMREVRTGVTKNTQGLSDDVLSKTATEFSTQSAASAMRVDLMARIAASTAIKHIFEKIIRLGEQYQDEVTLTDGVKLQPTKWKGRARCTVDIGAGPAERRDRINNLVVLADRMQALLAMGAPIVDYKKLYTVYSKLVQELGLNEPDQYFNDPEKPEQLLIAEIERLTRENQALQEQAQQNPLAEAEAIKAQAALVKAQGDAQVKIETERAKLEQQERFHDDQMAVELTKLEIDSKQNVQGALI